MTDLQTRLARYAELDAKRTKGEWLSSRSQSYREPDPVQFFYGVSVRSGEIPEPVINEIGDLEFPNAMFDIAFIALAPSIYADLLESRREVERLRAELDILNDTLDYYEKNSEGLT